jgi:hypothetical protein
MVHKDAAFSSLRCSSSNELRAQSSQHCTTHLAAAGLQFDMRSFKVSSCLSLIFFITCLVCTVSAQWRTQNYTDATTDCGFPRITRDNINRTSFNHWFEEQYNTFRDPDKWNKNDSLLRDYLLPRWSTVDPVSAASTCNVVQQCSVSIIVNLRLQDD